jgi:hypothetical protein
MGMLLNLMISSVAENSAVQPLSHNSPMDSSAFGLSSGNKWAVHAAGSNIGRSNSPSCRVDMMKLESAKKTDWHFCWMNFGAQCTNHDIICHGCCVGS